MSAAIPASIIGSILGAFAVAATLVRLAMPLLAAAPARMGGDRGAMLATALLFAVYPFMHTAWAWACARCCWALALGSVQPMIMSTLHQITPEHRHGEALGLRVMSLNASSVVMPLLFGAGRP